MRLDQYVVQKYPKLSRSVATGLIESAKVLVNGSPSKPGHKLHPTDKVTMQFDFKELEKVPKIDLPILFEDKDCMVINKPAGVLTHSKGAFNPEATVATFIKGHLSGMSGDRAGIVHRLDRATSGVIICAKTPEALVWLQKQFSLRKVKKTYQAVVEGQLEPQEALIDMPIERNPKHPQTFRVGEAGKPAQTEYKVLEEGQLSLLELRPLTGRTHQLRVHLKQLGHPIVGDSLYGGKQADRLYLHATTLEITLPSRERKIFTASLPNGFKNPLKETL